MKFILLALIVLSSIFSYSQLKQKTADAYFTGMEYSKCVEMYDELAKKAITGHKKGNWQNVQKAAESHYHLFEMAQACAYYEKLQGKNKLTEADRTLYIDALRYTEKYQKSITVIRESANLHPTNSFFKRMNDGSNKFSNLFKDSAFYRVKVSSISSDKGDFAPAYFNQSIVFASKAQNTGFITPKYGWDNDYYLNVMQSTFGSDSVLQKPSMLKNNFISKAHDGPVSFNNDGTEMIITKNTLGKKNGQDVIVLSIYFSQLTNGEWSELKAFEHNNSTYNVGHGVLSDDGQQLYFVSDQPNGKGGADIYVSTRTGSTWTSPENLGSSVNTERDEMFPFVQENMLYFSSNGHYGLGGLDIFEIELGSSKPTNIGYPVNTSNDDFGVIYEPTGRLGFLSSNRRDNIDRIYHVTKRKLKIGLLVNVYMQYEDLEPFPNQMVWIKNMTTSALDSIQADESGVAMFDVNINQEYRIYSQLEEFILIKEAELNTENLIADTVYIRDLILKPTTIEIHLRVVEKKTGKIIPQATTIISDYGNNTDTTLSTNDEGMVTFTVDRNKVMWAHGSKKGFIDADISFNTQNQDGKVFDIELALSPIRKGEKFKLENIFYDLNKSTLREESKSSLDKLADFIIKNDLKTELSAHTDSRGSSSYNRRLSQARAQSCVNYLKKKGVGSKNILAKGYGESKLINRCKNGVKCSEEEHQDNRRTEVKILEVN